MVSTAARRVLAQLSFVSDDVPAAFTGALAAGAASLAEPDDPAVGANRRSRPRPTRPPSSAS
jgi:hypothetical protein